MRAQDLLLGVVVMRAQDLLLGVVVMRAQDLLLGVVLRLSVLFPKGITIILMNHKIQY